MTNRADFTHYQGREVANRTDAERKAEVAAIVAERKAKEAEEAELARSNAEPDAPFDHIAYLRSLGIKDEDMDYIEIPGTTINRETGVREDIVFRVKA